jgi:ribosomal protein S18 acetylase RimI-like enzyme
MWGGDSVTTSVVEHWFAIPDIEPEHDIRVAVGGGGELIAYADVSNGGSSRTRFYIDLRLPAGLDDEVGNALVEPLEARAGRRAAANALTRGVYPAMDDAARRVFAGRGYVLVRHSLRMERSLADEPPEPEWPPGMTVRTASEDILERGWTASEEGFADHWEFESMPFEHWLYFVAGLEPDFTLWFLAMDGEEIAGTCLCSPLDWGDREAGFVNSLSVRPAWRRRGLALALLLHSFRELRARGRERVTLGVDAENTTGAVRLYERAGMHIARQFDLVDRPLDRPAARQP